MSRPLPRARSGSPVVIQWDVWNTLCDMVERTYNLRVDAPLHLSDSAAGRTISLVGTLTNVRGKIVAAAGGGGKYTCKIQQPPSASVSATGDLSAADLGTDGVDAYAFNQQEKGKSTHDLTMTPVVVDTFVGYVYTTADDGKLVVAINGLDTKDCATPPAQGDFAPAEDPSVYHTAIGSTGATSVASR